MHITFFEILPRIKQYMITSNGTISILLVDDDEINNFISIKLIKKALLNTDIMACLHGKYAIDLLMNIQDEDPSKTTGLYPARYKYAYHEWLGIFRRIHPPEHRPAWQMQGVYHILVRF